MIVTIAGRGARFSSESLTVSMTCSTSASDTRTALWPNSSITSSAVSASMAWFIVTIMPIFMSDLTTSAARSAIRFASSADHDGFRQLHVADLLFGLLAQTQRLGAGLFLLALHRGKAALTATFVRKARR
jgi:hypothetical protein